MTFKEALAQVAQTADFEAVLRRPSWDDEQHLAMAQGKTPGSYVTTEVGGVTVDRSDTFAGDWEVTSVE